MSLNPFSLSAQSSLSDVLRNESARNDRLKFWAQLHMPQVGAGLIFGSIVWPKGLGRPTAPQRCDGFSISLVAPTLQTPGTPGDGGGVETWIDSPPLPVTQKWDDSDDEQYWVHFLHPKPAGERLRVRINFAEGTGWLDEAGSPSAEQLLISPSVRAFGYKLPIEVIPDWIDPFHVIRARSSVSLLGKR